MSPGDVPPEVLQMPELVLMTQHFPVGSNPSLEAIATTSNDALTTVDYK